MSDSLPYITSPGTITTVLKKIQPAQTPEKFDAKFLDQKLGLKGGGPRSFIPFAKRIGLLSPDGTPTDLYKQFRGQGNSSTAIAKAMRIGFKALYESNDRAHELSPQELKALVIQVTGKEEKSSAVGQMIGCFNKLKEFAKFDGLEDDKQEVEEPADIPGDGLSLRRFNIAYTINLNLPETTNPAVFSAIFKALRENLLSEDEA